MRLKWVVAAVAAVLAASSLVVVLRWRSVDRLGAAVWLRPAPGAQPVLDRPRWSDRPRIGAERARRACDAGNRCAFPPGGPPAARLARHGSRVVWAFVADQKDVRYVTAVDARNGDLAFAAAAAAKWTLEKPPLGPGITVGIPYLFVVNSHCGVRYAHFDGRTWITDTPLNDGQGNPPDDWYQAEADQVATMTLLSRDLAEYRNRRYTVRFRPLDPSRDASPPPCL